MWRRAALAALALLATCSAGPVGPLPNATSSELLKQGTCAVGDVVYMAGDEFPGSSPCERCACARGGSVSCAAQHCEPRPCKALHRADQCCPDYQCECEHGGKVYANGEKLVESEEPCRVCYCQGGEVVCRRVACFVRHDCTPRLVPGRCCPEYDNCPIRGVTSLPGLAPASNFTPIKLETAPAVPKDDGPKITIKEITPVSEIPIITDVKIKEILPSPSIDVAEYSSSKSPLITREATSENTVNADSVNSEPETPSVVEIHSTETTSDSKRADEIKEADEPPSKISLSTQDSINSEIYPSNVPIVATMGVPAIMDNSPLPVATTTKSPMIEDDDASLFVEHNPAFPPIPDDLSVLSNHGDEIVPEPSAETDHVPVEHAPTPEVIIASITPLKVESKELPTTTMKYSQETSIPTTERAAETTTEFTTAKFETTSTTVTAPVGNQNPTVKLRSAIPTETVVASSDIPRTSQESVQTTTAKSELTSTTTSSTSAATTAPPTTTSAPLVSSTTTEVSEPIFTTATTPANEPTKLPALFSEESKSIEDMSIEVPSKTKKIEESSTEEENISKILEASTDGAGPKASEEFTTDEPEIPVDKVSVFAPSSSKAPETTVRPTEAPTTQQSSTTSQEQTTSSIAKSNAATEVTSQTELSSLPIETSDQKPHDAAENVSRDTSAESGRDSFTTSDRFSPSSESITVSKANGDGGDNVETTEFLLTSFGSSESATDAVELIKISGDTGERRAAVVDASDHNKNALSDLIKLVSDVASISEHSTADPFAASTIADSEELLPVNAGYKSKNGNFNLNSITEVPKSAAGAPAARPRPEIEDEEEGGLTDAPPPHDRVEPTTRRPLIDSVTAGDPARAPADRKDIEIITQAYVPTVGRRPTKVVAAGARDEAAGPAQ